MRINNEIIINKVPKDTVFYPTNDFIFRRIFGTEGNEFITQSFLSTIIPDKITSISLANNVELTRDNINDKYGILDVKATLNDNIKCDIEMQVSENPAMTNRIMYYWAKLFSEEFKKSEKYDKLKRTIIILILNYQDNLISLIPKIYTTWHIREDDFSKIQLTNMLEFHIISLPKLEALSIEKQKNIQSNYIDISSRLTLCSWMKFITNPNILEDSDMSNKGIKEATEQYNKLTQDEIEQDLAWRRAMAIADEKAIKDTAYNDGKAEGIKEANIEIAKKMLKSNKTISEIVEFTELSEDEINKLKE